MNTATINTLQQTIRQRTHRIIKPQHNIKNTKIQYSLADFKTVQFAHTNTKLSAAINGTVYGI